MIQTWAFTIFMCVVVKGQNYDLNKDGVTTLSEQLKALNSSKYEKYARRHIQCRGLGLEATFDKHKTDSKGTGTIGVSPFCDKFVDGVFKTTDTDDKPKNLIFMVGSGLGLAAMTIARKEKHKINDAVDHGKHFFKKNIYEDIPIAYDFMQYAGIVKTSSNDYYVSDAAAAMTALTSGWKVNNGEFLKKPGKTCKDKDWEINDGIAELALKAGMKFGLVTNGPLTHPTVAAVYAKVSTVKGKLCGAPLSEQLFTSPARDFSVVVGSVSPDISPETAIKKWNAIDTQHKAVSTLKIDNTSYPGLEDFEKPVYILPEAENLLVVTDSGKKNGPNLAMLAVSVRHRLAELTKNSDKGYLLIVIDVSADEPDYSYQPHEKVHERERFDDGTKVQETTFEQVVRRLVADKGDIKTRKSTGHAEYDQHNTLFIATVERTHAAVIPGYVPIDKPLDSLSQIKKNDQYPKKTPGPIPGVLLAKGSGANGKIQSAFILKEGEDNGGGEDVPLFASGPSARLFSGSMENTEVAYRIKYALCLDNKQKNMCTDSILPKPAEKSKDEDSGAGGTAPEEDTTFTFPIIILFGVAGVFITLDMVLIIMYLRMRDPSARQGSKVPTQKMVESKESAGSNE